jgi:DNA-3-methyladenine glycosylase II
MNVEIPLSPRQPFRFRHSLQFLELFPPTIGEQALAEGGIQKALRVGGQTVLFQLREERGRLVLALEAEATLQAPQLEAAVDRARFFLSLDDDLEPFYSLAQGDRALAPLIDALHGFHQVKLATPFECACWAILGQRCHRAVAQRMKHRIRDGWGGRIERRGLIWRAFPEPGDLAGLDPGALAAAIGDPVKARRIAALARSFDQVDEVFLRRGPRDQVEAWLRAIEGIGPWSAAFVLVRGLGRMDGLQGAERQLLPAFGEVYGDAIRSEADLLRAGRRYGEHQGYWALYVKTGAAWRGRSVLPGASRSAAARGAVG